MKHLLSKSPELRYALHQCLHHSPTNIPHSRKRKLYWKLSCVPQCSTVCTFVHIFMFANIHWNELFLKWVMSLASVILLILEAWGYFLSGNSLLPPESALLCGPEQVEGTFSQVSAAASEGQGQFSCFHTQRLVSHLLPEVSGRGGRKDGFLYLCHSFGDKWQSQLSYCRTLGACLPPIPGICLVSFSWVL